MCFQAMNFHKIPLKYIKIPLNHHSTTINHPSFRVARARPQTAPVAETPAPGEARRPGKSSFGMENQGKIWKHVRNTLENQEKRMFQWKHVWEHDGNS